MKNGDMVKVARWLETEVGLVNVRHIVSAFIDKDGAYKLRLIDGRMTKTCFATRWERDGPHQETRAEYQERLHKLNQ